MNILIIDNRTCHLRALKNRLEGHIIRVVKYRHYQDSDEANADLIILSGGHTSVLRHGRFYTREIDFIRLTTKPIIGICLGHELIAKTYGIRPSRMLRKAHGIKHIKLMSDVQSNMSNTLKVYEAHRYAVKDLPAKFRQVAGSARGVEVMMSPELKRFSVQFHPEVIEPANQGMEIFNYLLSLAILE